MRDLLGGTGLIDGRGRTTCGHGAELCDDPLWTVIAAYRDRIARLMTQHHDALGEGANALPILGPGMTLPVSRVVARPNGGRIGPSAGPVGSLVNEGVARPHIPRLPRNRATG